MSRNISNTGRPAFYTVREAAWILGAKPSEVHRAIRVGTLRAVRRRSRLVVPASALAQMLDSPSDPDVGERAVPVNDDCWLIETARRLDRLRWVPQAALTEIVRRRCSCIWIHGDDAPRPATDGDMTERDLAAEICAGCPVHDECLELELRLAGEQTTGVWGALSETDRRALYSHWLLRDEDDEDPDADHLAGEPRS